ncbi:MAG: 50S ribosomal protein L11 methyltransferase, partial [Smithellaceae bacterium]|nr:50S ribosomal protein L11 methyltransferase [Smithellaceae bacterium]
EQWKKYFLPLRVSKNIVVKPTWERYTASGHDIVVEIDPGMAFGTGQHPSTRMCIEAVEEIILKGGTDRTWHVLDVGCGTGILGIASAKLGAQKVLCIDIDKKAVEISRENVLINAVQDKVEVRETDLAQVKGSFDLIVANLTSKILIKLRPRLLELLKKDGFLVVSGIIEQNADDMARHFYATDLLPEKSITEKEWICYIFRKKRS